MNRSANFLKRTALFGAAAAALMFSSCSEESHPLNAKTLTSTSGTAADKIIGDISGTWIIKRLITTDLKTGKSDTTDITLDSAEFCSIHAISLLPDGSFDLIELYQETKDSAFTINQTVMTQDEMIEEFGSVTMKNDTLLYSAEESNFRVTTQLTRYEDALPPRAWTGRTSVQSDFSGTWVLVSEYDALEENGTLADGEFVPCTIDSTSCAIVRFTPITTGTAAGKIEMTVLTKNEKKTYSETIDTLSADEIEAAIGKARFLRNQFTAELREVGSHETLVECFTFNRYSDAFPPASWGTKE